MVSSTDEKIAQRAYHQATLSPCLMRHGCVATLNGSIIAHGHNNHRLHSRDKILNNQSCTCHAEIATIRALFYAIGAHRDPRKLKKFKKIVMYCVRVDREGNPRDSMPCVACAQSMKDLGIKRVVFSKNNGFLESEKIKDYDTAYRSQSRKNLSEKKN